MTDLTAGSVEMKSVAITPELIHYVRQQIEPLSPAQQFLIARTHGLGGVAEMQIPPEQGPLLTLLTKLVGARTVVEVGTFTGYSTLAFAVGLQEDGRVITLDLSREWTAVAVEGWELAGVRDRIQTVIGPAAESLRALPEDIVIDLAFIDADKVSYIDYWEAIVPRGRPGGLIIADNVLYCGEAVSSDATGNGKAIRQFNAHVHADQRVETVLLTVADGLTIGRKK